MDERRPQWNNFKTDHTSPTTGNTKWVYPYSIGHEGPFPETWLCGPQTSLLPILFTAFSYLSIWMFSISPLSHKLDFLHLPHTITYIFGGCLDSFLIVKISKYWKSIWIHFLTFKLPRKLSFWSIDCFYYNNFKFEKLKIVHRGKHMQNTPWHWN